MAGKKQKIDFYGDPHHRHPGIHAYFASEAFFDRLIAEKKKHLAIEQPYPLQRIADDLWSRKISVAKYTDDYMRYKAKTIRENPIYSDAMKKIALAGLPFYAKDSANVIEKAREYGIKIHFIDHADALDKAVIKDPIMACYKKNNIKTESEDEALTLLYRERLAQDPAIAKRVIAKFKGKNGVREDGAVIFGQGHAEHKAGIPQSLEAQGAEVKMMPVFYGIEGMESFKSNYEEKNIRGLDLNPSLGLGNIAIDAQTGQEMAIPSELKQAASQAAKYGGQWDYNQKCNPKNIIHSN